LSELFERIFVPSEFRESVSDRAWLQAMLDAERALAAAEARAEVLPAEAAEAIAAACSWERFNPAELADDGRAAGNPVEPLVRALTAEVEPEAAGYVHWGATSQDILDTAGMLVSRRALDLLLEATAAVARECARLADTHRGTLMAGRTLLQQAVPTTFGLKAAGWLMGVVEARRGLVRARERLAVQLGGAAGTLAPLGEAGPDVLRLFAEELGLENPLAPWHTNRVRIAELGAALAVAAGALAKIGLDIALMAQTEVAEVAEAEGGVSSTMPQKRNPVGSVLAIACARQAAAQASVLIAAVPQEHERAAGGWHSEWPALSAGLAYTGGAADGARRALAGLEVDAERMRANLGSAAMAEQQAFALAEQVGRREAYARVAREGVPGDLDPAGYLGSAETFVDRVLALYRSEVP
jgi:3-carboxy-cis,cis-muconate cycloisomerase